jgi:hypothetical protein
VTDPGGPASSSLTIASFSVIEFQYAPDNRWFYAPQIEVIETSGVASATVTKMSFAIPGLGQSPLFSTSKCVAPGQQIALLHEVYGDFEFTIDNPTVGRASPGNATVNLTFVDPQGRGATITATGPIVPGQLPSSYSNPPLSWSCSSGEGTR